jgi:plastocyanin
MSCRLSALGLGLVLLVAVSPSDAAGVSGVVQREPAAAAAPKSVSRYQERSRRPAPDEEPAASCNCNPGLFAVVHLTGEGVAAPSPSGPPPTMAQRDRRFEPSVLAIPVGGAVSFPNEDPFFHNVFSYSKVRAFDLGRYPRGETHEVVFDQAGIIPVFCEIHYSMRAYIHVFDTPYFAVSDEARRFEIPDVAPGDYTLHVWQENLPEITRPVRVGTDPITLEVR